MEQEIIVLGATHINLKDVPFYGKAERIVEGLLFHYKIRRN